MKLSPKGLLAAAVLALGFVGQANAAILTETYSAPPSQLVREGQSFSFGFDFLSPSLGDVSGLTNSNLQLTQDVALGDLTTQFSSMSLTIGLASTDLMIENTKLGIFVRDFSFTETTYTKIFDFTWNGTFFDPYYVETYVMPSGFVKAFNDSLYADVVIRATNQFWYNNDFSIFKVSLSGNTASVPEPASLALLGLGLLGVGAFARRRAKR